MAHEFETGFFTRTPAWHKLGIVLPEAPSPDEALTLSGLDWKVEPRPVFTADGTSIDTHRAITRITDSAVLGVVSKSFVPLQNNQLFRFLAPFVEEGACALEAAGSLKGGKRVWALAKLKGEEAEVVDGDKVRGYFLLSNSHDGTQAFRAQFTSIRVVCWNTLSKASARADKGIEDCLRVRHTSGIEAGVVAVQKAVDMAGRTFAATVQDYQRMVSRSLPVDGLERYVSEVLKVPEDREQQPKGFHEVIKAYHQGPGATLKGVMGTYWGAYNAVTDWVDHHRGRTGEGARLDSAWFGHGAAIKQRAFEMALQ